MDERTYSAANTRLLCCCLVRNAGCRIGRLESARVAPFKNIYQFALINLHFPELIRIFSGGLHSKAYAQVSQGRGRDDVLVVHFEEVFFAWFGFEGSTGANLARSQGQLMISGRHIEGRDLMRGQGHDVVSVDRHGNSDQKSAFAVYVDGADLACIDGLCRQEGRQEKRSSDKTGRHHRRPSLGRVAREAFDCPHRCHLPKQRNDLRDRSFHAANAP
jgi:hypothetical protein